MIKSKLKAESATATAGATTIGFREDLARKELVQLRNENSALLAEREKLKAQLCAERLSSLELLAERDALRAAMKAILKTCKEGVIQRNETGKPQWSALDHMEAIASTALALSKGGQ
jgi:hypothetical protein